MSEIIIFISGLLYIFFIFYFGREYITGKKDMLLYVDETAKKSKPEIIFGILCEEMILVFIYEFINLYTVYSKFITCVLFGLMHIPFLSKQALTYIYIKRFFFTSFFRLLFIYMYLYSVILPFIVHVAWNLSMFHIINSSSNVNKSY